MTLFYPLNLSSRILLLLSVLFAAPYLIRVADSFHGTTTPTLNTRTNQSQSQSQSNRNIPHHYRGSCATIITSTTAGATATATTSSSSSTSVTAALTGSDLTFDVQDDKNNNNNDSKKNSVNDTAGNPFNPTTMPLLSDPRSCILRVGADAGRLCVVGNQMLLEQMELQKQQQLQTDSPASEKQDAEISEELSGLFVQALSELFASLCLTSQSLRLNWARSIRAKMALNAKKYPVEHCKVCVCACVLVCSFFCLFLPYPLFLVCLAGRSKNRLFSFSLPIETILFYLFQRSSLQGKAGKYTKYSHLTGITTTNQSTMDYKDDNDSDNDKNNNAIETSKNSNSNNDNGTISLEDFAHQHLKSLSDDIRVFAEARLWAKYHKPRNLILALMGEVGELAELLQWDGDDTFHSNNNDNCEPNTLDKLSQELADVSIYAIRLATVCNVVDGLRESLVLKSEQDGIEVKQL